MNEDSALWLTAPGITVSPSPFRFRELSEEELEDGYRQLAGRDDWKTLLSGYLPTEAEELPLELMEALLLIGPAGAGKHALLQGLEGELEDAGFVRVLVDLASVPEGQMQSFLAAAAELVGERDTVIRLEHIESLRYEDYIKLLNACNQGNQLIFTAALTEGKDVEPELQKLFSVFSVSLPTEDDLLALLRKELPGLSGEVEKQFLKRSRDYDYCRANSLVAGLRLIIRSNMREKRKDANYCTQILSKYAVDMVANRLLPLPAEEAPPETGEKESVGLNAVLSALQAIAASKSDGAPTGDAAETVPQTPVIKRTINSADDLIEKTDSFEDILSKLSLDNIDEMLQNEYRESEES